jgi:hypothetical protein
MNRVSLAAKRGIPPIDLVIETIATVNGLRVHISATCSVCEHADYLARCVDVIRGLVAIDPPRLDIDLDWAEP